MKGGAQGAENDKRCSGIRCIVLLFFSFVGVASGADVIVDADVLNSFLCIGSIGKDFR